MRCWIAAVPVALAASVSFSIAVPARAEAPLVDHTEWVSLAGRPSLRVYPTPAGRAAAARLDTDDDAAWREVLTAAPDADTPGMREQFRCHWDYAELAQPGKTSWNLEPWRPVVDEVTMLETGCNPGGPEETF
ncbi:DUF2599 domain-containing protein [Mycobacterium sp. M1]|uniref:DUF2599 domain-containing protein n=1 Tax=Mycolicibacter acidiphilus TaxID=2835306 RepID=A0ABS5RF14_9MYCO|nr:DUF2599 domain-containing protein [Mycolicibacter acidiphilus]MBS9532871.1 DUF2599 domain-containing protein [Mycolicibacter acidiphilus]